MRTGVGQRIRGGALAATVVAVGLAGVAVARAEDRPPTVVSAVSIPPGQIDAAVAQLDTIAPEMLAKTGVPGMSIAVVHDDRVVYAKGFGVRSTATGAPVDAGTVFQLASVSKSLGATVVARTVGAGILGWDDLVTRYLPWFRLKDPSTTRQLTIADLYSHRSGLPDHAGDLLEDLGYDRRQVLRRLRFEPLTPIRSHYAYTNFGMTAGAVAVARAARTSWEELSRRELYAPLGMTSTSSRYADFARSPDHAALHVKVGGAWQPRYSRDADVQSPAGGASSSAVDMAKWMRLVLADGAYDGGQLIARGPLGEIATPHMLSSPPAALDARSGFYGLGMNVGNDATGRVRLSHSGAFALGAATSFTMLPAEHLGIVVLTNGQPLGLPEAVAATFMDLAELGHPERDWLAAYGQAFAGLLENHSRLAGRQPPAHPKPARPERAYVGSYPNAYYGAARVTVRRGRLTLLLGPRHDAFRLSHWSGDTFAYTPPGENSTGRSAVTFGRLRGGRASTVRIENLDETGLGTFRRR